MDPALDALLRVRLDAAADLPPEAKAEVTRALGPGAAPAGSDAAAASGDAATTREQVYLRSVTVEGFRGIGPAATLELDARPGLTVVVGRNGSGKSSFAEGLELLATGATKRWEGKSRGWTDTWQCLHHGGPTRLQAEFVVAGDDTPVVLEQAWGRGAEYTDASGRTDADAVLRAHGWDAALASFRPFLAYAELATMFDKLASLPAALSPILGLDELDGLAASLADTRLAIERRAKESKAEAAAIVARLDDSDERQATLAALLTARKPKLDDVRAHLAAHPPGAGTGADPATAATRRLAAAPVPDDDALRDAHTERDAAAAAVTSLATTDTSRALATADLLNRALRLRDPARLTDGCPVCRTANVLDAGWAAAAQTQVDELRTQAAQLAAAERARDGAAAAWRSLAGAVAAVDGEPLDPDAGALDAVLARAAAARTAVAAAQASLAAQDAVWRAHAEATTAWLAGAESAAADAGRLTALKAAEKWLKAEIDTLRNERFAPIAAQAVANWELLRHESNVELRDITLRSVGRRKEAMFDVRADGEDANALGVMSQGELLALSVSVFLPRAALDESPFRFAIIDDPVQSMDPAKVDGLARILSQAAATRQVVVFTHDDRLPEAIRRLKLTATILQVNRRSRSQVSVTVSKRPFVRHLDDARRLMRSNAVPAEVQQRVVPTLCRTAVEAACAELVRARVVADGLDAAAADEQLEAARTLRDLLTLALLGPAGDQADLTEALRREGGPDANGVVGALNAGSHGQYADSVEQLHRRTSDLVRSLMESAA
ncbi:AAA family ATPase [Paraconexibacter antarcticus]|uniref:Nuclease SbcCD subunit C n=1 Tax=Paraconexibacter antarcticus TaxID=2949664 RepID=A0ABY5DT40_9ACTN|nr:AAA family ATPase [Paraconexibacter antarcticus]UTI65196.1 AAA family ATPase [Paraconexibacter antarcticus]